MGPTRHALVAALSLAALPGQDGRLPVAPTGKP